MKEEKLNQLAYIPNMQVVQERNKPMHQEGTVKLPNLASCSWKNFDNCVQSKSSFRTKLQMTKILVEKRSIQSVIFSSSKIQMIM